MRIPPSGPMAFHQAVAQNDIATIQKLRQQGYKPVALDQHGNSPLDALANRRDIDGTTRARLYHSLLASLNPSAPSGYIKPEAFHGSPWGFEILRSGALKGGVNDPKGGSQSLEGKVFFSDRTRESSNKFETRENLRQKPRVYAKGLGIKPTTVETRSNLYVLSKAINHASSASHFPASTLTLKSSNNLEEAVYDSLVRLLSNNGYRLKKETPEQILQQTGVPAHIKFVDNSHPPSGEQTRKLIGSAFQRIENEMVSGKLPFLNLLNNGQTLPLVFGFSKVNNLKTHTIHNSLSNTASMFNYQAENHPLSGTANGGKLKEIEVKSLADLATLTLACKVRNVALPKDALIRINPTPNEKKQHGLKALYLDASALARFSHALLGSGTTNMGRMTLEQLQSLNHTLREKAENGSLRIR
ncbi:ankyrin repeat domain-containing protein [Enterobacter sp. Ap-1006]|uniref:ankyrin repeat domain-containing protein n=1 Tax=Enterobacter sp. Ap-1006 TaxID=2608345 RepID=UPI001424742A|nr:ankyrin repeat domain-containing protein [Enterobacter sp. Ap-1006]NIF48075.1 ankyrin repeat domain-containing protein [Enterobacter sp. Ap-1006]